MGESKSYRKIVLRKSQLRNLFNIPKNVEIATAYVETDPFSLQILLVADKENMPWTEEFYRGESEEGFEDAESYILSHGSWEAWPNH